MIFNKKDISIGKDRWIKWLEFDSSVPTFNIDQLVFPMEEFFKILEVDCVAECCGIYAFSFWEEDIINALQKIDSCQLYSELKTIMVGLKKVPQSVFTSTLLNQLIHKETFINLLEHFIKVTKCYNAL